MFSRRASFVIVPLSARLGSASRHTIQRSGQVHFPRDLDTVLLTFSPHDMTTINPYSEAVLYTSSSSREKWDNCANLYSLILSVDALERAYVSQAITEEQYGPICTRLLSQVKTSIKLITSSAQSSPDDPPIVSGLDDFMKLWGLDLPLTSHRLQLGIPATLEHPSSGNGLAGSSASGSALGGGIDRSKNVAETTQAFITLMDALKLKLRAKDQLHPLLGEAVSCWNRSGGGGGSEDAGDGQSEKRGKLVGW